MDARNSRSRRPPGGAFRGGRGSVAIVRAQQVSPIETIHGRACARSADRIVSIGVAGVETIHASERQNE